MLPSKKPTYLQMYEEFLEISQRIEKMSKNENLSIVDLKELLRLTEKAFILAKELINAPTIKEMFLRDARDIKESYLNQALSRADAQKALQDLEEYARELHRRTFELREHYQRVASMSEELNTTFHKLERLIESLTESLTRFNELSYPPQYGVPITDLIQDIIQGIEDITGVGGLPKRTFGILQLSKTSYEGVEEKIAVFLDEYSSGVIIAPSPDLRDRALKILKRREKLQVDEREIRGNYLLMVQPKKSW